MSRPDATSSAARLRVGYVLKRFPRLSQTFVANEIAALETLGTAVDIFSMLPGDDVPGIGQRRVHLLRDGRSSPGRHHRALARLAPGRSAEELARLAAWADDLCRVAAGLGLSSLHAHFGSDATTVALLAGDSLGLPVSFTAHARDIYKAYGTPAADRAMRIAKIAAADRVVTVSDYNRQHLVGLAGEEHADRIVRLYNGVDLRRFAPAPAGAREPGLILAVGRLVAKKGFSVLVDACARLAARGLAFRCDVIGDGPLSGDLAGQIAGHGLSGRIRLVGARSSDEVAQAMREASVFALPCVVTGDGDRDGLPTVLIEALASGLPCVSTRLAGIPEIIEHGRSGLLCEPGDAAGLADALGTLLGNRDLAAGYAAAGRARAERQFNLTANVRALQAHFEDMSQRAAASVAAE